MDPYQFSQTIPQVLIEELQETNMAISFVVTRYPLVEFSWNGMSGRWGELIAIKGPKLTMLPSQPKRRYLGRAKGYQRLEIGSRYIHMSSDGTEIQETLRYTTMERFRANSNHEVYYVRLPARTDPYLTKVQYGNTTVAGLRPVTMAAASRSSEPTPPRSGPS